MHAYEQLPAGYRLVFRLDLQNDTKAALAVNGAALALALGLFAPAAAWTGLPFARLPAAAALLRLAATVLGLAAYFVLHELVHGVCMRLFSRLPVRYGFTGLYAFAGSDAYFAKRPYILIALAPVVLWGAVLAALCAAAGPGWFWVFYLIEIVNVSGAAGDFYVTARLLRLSPAVLVRDAGVSMEMYAPGGKA